MRTVIVLLFVLPLASLGAQVHGFGVCKPVSERTTEKGCWILVDREIGPAGKAALYWHLDRYADSASAARAASASGVVIRALRKTWLMTIDTNAVGHPSTGTHVADIGPLAVSPGVAYSALFMEAITAPGYTSAIHRHSGPEAWYTAAGETCLETPAGTIVGKPRHPAVVPEGPPMRLTTTGTHVRRAITLILHDAGRTPTTMETSWKPKGLCR